MQHGEVPAQLNPPIWWILIGTNDFNRDASCSPEVVVMGMQRVLEEMISRKPQAHIVVNSLLPRATDHPQGWLMDQGVVSSSPQQHHDPLTLDESGNTPTTSSSHPNTATPTTSLWQDIQTVNQAMERYIQAIQQEQRAKVWFFNATSLLLRPHNHTVPHSTYYIPVEYMSDYLHPTAAGYRIWGNAMITFMKKNMNLT
jgi:lysophospholipase L1-like esterase